MYLDLPTHVHSGGPFPMYLDLGLKTLMTDNILNQCEEREVGKSGYLERDSVNEPQQAPVECQEDNWETQAS